MWPIWQSIGPPYLIWVMMRLDGGIKKSSTRSKWWPTGGVWMVWWDVLLLACLITYHTMREPCDMFGLDWTLNSHWQGSFTILSDLAHQVFYAMESSSLTASFGAVIWNVSPQGFLCILIQSCYIVCGWPENVNRIHSGTKRGGCELREKMFLHSSLIAVVKKAWYSLKSDGRGRRPKIWGLVAHSNLICIFNSENRVT